jgi:hypothetical protein
MARQNRRERGDSSMMYRRDNRNRSLDDFNEAKPKSGLRTGRKPERGIGPQAAPALAAAPAIK